MKNKNNTIMYGALILIGGVVVYSLIQAKKKRNKLEVSVKDEIADLQSQLNQANKNIGSVSIRQNPELQKTLTNLSRFGRKF